MGAIAVVGVLLALARVPRVAGLMVFLVVVGGVLLAMGVGAGAGLATEWYLTASERRRRRARLAVELALVAVLGGVAAWKYVHYEHRFYSKETRRCGELAEEAERAAGRMPDGVSRRVLRREAAWFSREARLLRWEGAWPGWVWGRRTAEYEPLSDEDLVRELVIALMIERHEQAMRRAMEGR